MQSDLRGSSKVRAASGHALKILISAHNGSKSGSASAAALSLPPGSRLKALFSHWRASSIRFIRQQKHATLYRISPFPGQWLAWFSSFLCLLCLFAAKPPTQFLNRASSEIRGRFRHRPSPSLAPSLPCLQKSRNSLQPSSEFPSEEGRGQCASPRGRDRSAAKSGDRPARIFCVVAGRLVSPERVKSTNFDN